MSFTTAGTRNERTASAPYVAFTTFKNFVRSLNENGLPSHVDKSVMNGLSGGVRSHLASAIRFLGLVNEDLTPTHDLETLVESYDGDDWQENLAALIQGSYAEITDGVDIEKATPNQLDKCFDSQSAVMIDKSVRFLLSALDDAEVPYSTHLKKRKPKAKRKSSPRQSAKTDKNEPSAEKGQGGKPELPTGMREYPIHLSNDRTGLIQFPSDIDMEDCEMIELMLPMLRKLAERNSQ